MNEITFVPVGGLANRMRAIASALTLAKQADSRLKVYGSQLGICMLLLIAYSIRLVNLV